jgi:hypothetical protein
MTFSIDTGGPSAQPFLAWGASQRNGRQRRDGLEMGVLSVVTTKFFFNHPDRTNGAREPKIGVHRINDEAANEGT